MRTTDKNDNKNANHQIPRFAKFLPYLNCYGLRETKTGRYCFGWCFVVVVVGVVGVVAAA